MSPGLISKYVLVLFVALLTAIYTYVMLSKSGDDSIFSAIMFLLSAVPMQIAPAGLCVFVAIGTKRLWKAWLFLTVEIVFGVATIWLLTEALRSTDAQNGIALGLFVLLQFALFVGMLTLSAIVASLARRLRAFG